MPNCRAAGIDASIDPDACPRALAPPKGATVEVVDPLPLEELATGWCLSRS